MKALGFLLISSFITPLAAHSSALPENGECKVKILITELMQHDTVAFKIIETNCDFLSTDSLYQSSTIYSRDGGEMIQIHATLEGEIARSSSMGENGAVHYAVFEHPSFTGKNTVSFTFSY